MAIQKFRDMTEGLVAKIIVGLIIIVFALFGFGSITTFLAPVPKVATVNGEDITTGEMEVAVERNRRLLLAQNVAPQDIDEDMLREQVLQSLVQRKVLTQVTDDLGLHYSEAALDAEIVATPMFQIDGVFNAAQFQNVVAGAGFTPMNYREEMGRDKKFEQLNTAIRSTAFTTDEAARRLTSLSRQTRDIAYLLLRVEDLLAEVTVEESEIEAFYDEHRDEYYSQEQIDLEYVSLRLDDLVAEIEVDETELVAYFEDVQEQYSQDERRRVAHILVEITDDVEAEAARTRIDAIYERIINGEDFAALARETSEDPGSAEAGGDLGFNQPGTFVEEFEAVAWDLGALNQVSQPVQTEFGFHIIKLLGIEEARTPTLDEIRGQVEMAYRESLAEDLFVSRSSELDELSFEAADLMSPADELGLTVESTGLVSRADEGSLLANPRVADMAFSPDVLVDGNNSPLIELSGREHVVVRVKEHQPSRLRPLAEVREEIVASLTREKATAEALARAETMVAELESGAITRYVADQAGLEWTVLPGVSRFQRGLEADITRTAFELPRPQEGDKSVGSAALPSGDVVVLSVTNVQTPSAIAVTANEVADMKRLLTQRRGVLDFAELQRTAEDAAAVKRFN